jgi:glycosyltransferase involved in cell wall biosynthesis
LGIPDDAFVVGFVGRLEYQKAPDLLLRAIAICVRQNKAIRLVVVGSGSMDAQLREMARTLDIEKYITWLGYQPSQHWLASFDMLAMPSRYEGFSLMPLEAMYASLPIVCTSVGGIAETVCDGVTGIVVTQADESAFAAAILELAKHPQLRNAMGSATRRRAGMFPPDAMVTGIEQIYRSALTRSRKGMRHRFGQARSSKSEGGC